MSVNFGNTNASRYYSVPDAVDFTLPDGDWTWVGVVKRQDNGADAKYLISTNTVQTANSFSLLIAGTTGGVLGVYNSGAFLETLSNPLPANTWAVIYASRRSGNMYVGWKPQGGGTGAESAAQAITGTSDGTTLILGGRNDFNTARMWLGSVSWVALLKGKGLTATEVNDLAAGTTVLMNASYAAQVSNLWWLQSSTPATVTDSVNSRIATKQGTGYSADDTDPLPPIAAATKGITLQLFNGASNVGALTGIQAAFFDQAEPKDFLAPVFKTSTATTDSSGNITLNVDAQTALSIGQNGFVVLYKLDGTDHKLSPALATRATIVDIA